MYKKIVNPLTGRLVNTNGIIGRKILQNYINQLGGGRKTNVEKYTGHKMPKFAPMQKNKTSTKGSACTALPRKDCDMRYNINRHFIKDFYLEITVCTVRNE